MFFFFSYKTNQVLLIFPFFFCKQKQKLYYFATNIHQHFSFVTLKEKKFSRIALDCICYFETLQAISMQQIKRQRSHRMRDYDETTGKKLHSGTSNEKRIFCF
jgi:hypothetical protein